MIRYHKSGGEQAEVGETNGLPVQVISTAPGTAAASLGKAEDAAHASGDVGVMLLAVRKDTAAALAADGDYHVVEVDASGQLRVAALVASEAHVGQVGGGLTTVSVEFTRPSDTNAYIAGDVVSNSVSATVFMAFAALARVAGGSGYIVRASLSTNKKSITPRFRVHLFNVANASLGTAIVGDNVPLVEKYADASFRMGYFDLPAMTTAADATNSDMSRAMDNTLRHPVVFAPGSTTLFALLEALDGFSPASGQLINLKLFLDCN